ncbi:tetratricopeptide repeat protein [Actinophytocola sp.]|uniref:tetratricopeptide repeat protein n=1 Tax=Actinophytocola sp. TaxID=1872138 RepID=UPI002DBEDC32|nr:tetratricopeptide repeat protein [Actinophytocola sp.]
MELFAAQLADRIRVKGPGHPGVLSTRFQIAVWTSNAGDPVRAIELFTQLLADSIRVLGEHHPHTVATGYRLGLSARAAGRLDLAAEQFAVTHDEWTNRFGPDSPQARKAGELIYRIKAE